MSLPNKSKMVQDPSVQSHESVQVVDETITGGMKKVGKELGRNKMKLVRDNIKQHAGEAGDVFIKSILCSKVSLNVSNIGGNISNTIQTILSKRVEGKCGENGFVKEGSVKIMTYSNGVCRAASVVFDVVYECQVCNPVQGTSIECVVKNVTRAGIRAELDGYSKSPLVIFVARDHHYSLKEFSTINEGERIWINVVGQRFELNDEYVSVIAELDAKEIKKRSGNKQPLLISIK